MNFRQFLNEMRIHKLDGRPNRFIAFRGHLWLYNMDLSEKEAESIFYTITSEHPMGDELKQRRSRWADPNDPLEVESWVNDNIVDAVSGAWDSRRRILYLDRSAISPTSSPLVKKVMTALNARSISYDMQMYYGKSGPLGAEKYDYADEEFKTTKRKALGETPSSLYHGTSTEHLAGIFKFGLKAEEAPSNYPQIIHEDKVFLTAKYDEAAMHAVHTAGKVGGHPVVLLIKVPDPNKIVPDFDVDLSTPGSSTTYATDTEKHKQGISSVGAMKTNKQVGLFGYQGRIPASFIENVYLRLNKKWKKVRLDTLKKRIEEDPWEWTYHYGLYEENNEF